MDAIDKNRKLIKARIAFWINLPICLMSVFAVYISIDSMVLWKIIASSMFSLVFINMTMIVFQKLRRLQEVD
jgi:hypothetical protein